MILDVNKPQKQVKIPIVRATKLVINTHKLLITYVLGLGLLSASCGSLPKESAEAQSQRPGDQERGRGVTPVDVAIARTQLLSQQPDKINGKTTPFREVTLRSRSEGRLLALNLNEGDSVTRGQLVGQLDDALLVTALRQAEAELAARQSEVARAATQVNNARVEVERARLEVVQARADSKRQQQLYKEGAIAAQTAEQANTKAQTATQALRAATEQVRTEKQAVAAAQGRVFAQQAVVSQAKERLSYARLISPITGLVIEKALEPGDFVQTGGEVLKIGDFSRIKVEVQVSDSDLAEIEVGQSVQVSLEAFAEQTLIGRVTRIYPVADVTPFSRQVEVVIANSGGKIGSGLRARVNFATQTNQRVVVPQIAINQGKVGQTQSEDSNGIIFVVQDTGEKKKKVTSRSVTLGEKANGQIEILSGLQPGESYVVRSGKPLKDGEAVSLSFISENAKSNPTGT
ncbi:efflux RND transporter periplasmic adaptor subunit [Cylindrospermum sp. FACHB-282]|uniref:efflux RND transporter periplasmic adaptor subunit n=1 Tax=Cylindrospermum sp. FACHB-282 TaxID=2692794 RepID=UPI001687035C|nr:efflux RND transporter periplasmic adaptor subunit [Cylindrospermum sp. FACHB-282]MBD2384597.1 efflux RND transporter periplasmic adaptor subunit [Cylindrospermum sp. FACHB-282]